MPFYIAHLSQDIFLESAKLAVDNKRYCGTDCLKYSEDIDSAGLAFCPGSEGDLSG